MNIYHDETIKTYSDLNLTALQEPQACNLKKSTEIEATLRGFLYKNLLMVQITRHSLLWYHKSASLLLLP